MTIIGHEYELTIFIIFYKASYHKAQKFYQDIEFDFQSLIVNSMK
jgi:hypothetical protein